MSNMAKLRRMNKDHLAEVVQKAYTSWNVDEMDGGSKGGIDEMVSRVTALLQSASDTASPESKVKKTDHPSCPWWTTELHKLRRLKNIEKNRLRKHPHDMKQAKIVKKY